MEGQHQATIRRRSGHYTYHYNLGENLGELQDGSDTVKVAVVVMKRSEVEATCKVLRTFSHKNLLECKYVNECPNLDDKIEILHERFDSRFDDFMAQKRITKAFSIAGLHRDIYTITDEYRNCFRDIVRFLVHLHAKEYCTNGFTLANLVWKGQVLKFYNVKFMEVKSSDDNFNARVKRDFVWAYHVVLKIFEQTGANSDEYEDMRDFLQKLLFFRSGNSEFIENHIALLRSDQRLSFMVEAHKKKSTLRYLHKSRPYREAVSELGNNSGWDRKIPVVLRPAEGSYETNGPNYVKVNSEMIRCWRNMTVHMFDDKSFNCAYTEEHVEAVIMSIFGEQIADFQFQLYRKRVLFYFSSVL